MQANRLREAGLSMASLEVAIDEFFEEGYAYQVNQREIDDTPEELRPQAIRDMLPERSQQDGVYTWVRYLVWLDSVRDLAPELRLTAVEVQGLQLYRRCRAQFQRTHPPCSHCGMPNGEEEYRCHNCMKELKR